MCPYVNAYGRVTVPVGVFVCICDVCDGYLYPTLSC